MLVRTILAAVALCLTFSATPTYAQERSSDHDAIRELRDRALNALNERNYDLVADDLHTDFTFVSVDNKVFYSTTEFAAYWEDLHRTVVEGIDLKLTVDELTKFLSEDVGIATGTATGTFHFKKLEARTMDMRWSAVLKRQDGRWSIRLVHFSANLLDNPVLDAAKSASATLWTGVSAVLALVIGFLAGWFFFRGRPA